MKVRKKKTCHFGGGINREARDETRGRKENSRKNKETKPDKRAVEEAHSAELDRDDHVENKSLCSCNLWESARGQKTRCGGVSERLRGQLYRT